MAKMNEDKAAMYLVAIVGVVAAVGILVLLMNAGVGSSSDYSGEAIRTMSSSSSSGISSTSSGLSVAYAPSEQGCGTCNGHACSLGNDGMCHCPKCN